MANYAEFLGGYEDQLIDVLRAGNLKSVVELWIDFMEQCAMKANSKLRDLDDIFG